MVISSDPLVSQLLWFILSQIINYKYYHFKLTFYNIVNLIHRGAVPCACVAFTSIDNSFTN